MKIALCLHGYFDSRMDNSSKGSDGYHHIKKNILDKADIDVYIHSWQPELKEKIKGLYNPVDSIFETQINFSSIVKDLGLENMPADSSKGRSPSTILSHFYSIQKCFKLVDFKKYNLIIKSRFDLGRINRMSSQSEPVQCINFNPNCDPRKLYMADWSRFKDGPADMWYYGGPEIMKNFTTFYDDIKSIINTSNVNAIHLVKQWMIEKKIWDLKKPLTTTWE